MGGGSLTPDQSNRIAVAVEDIEQNVSRLRGYQDLSREEYCAEENQERRDAVERKFEKLTAAVIDIAETILAAERQSVPGHRKQTLAELQRQGVIDATLEEKLRESVGFRDVLAHAYGPVVNDDMVYDAVQNSLERYVRFLEAVDCYLDSVA